MSTTATPLKPRKSPVQRRSTTTVDALHVAAIQVLSTEGLQRCTTTRIAERAGTSVGSLYQYYPNRDALLAATLGKHLDRVAEVVEVACAAQHGEDVATMAAALVRAFLSEKLRNPEESKSLYAVANGLDGATLVTRMRKRMMNAVTDMLTTASDAHFADPSMTATFLLGAMVGPVQSVLQGHTPMKLKPRLEPELITMLTAYLRTHLTPARAPKPSR